MSPNFVKLNLVGDLQPNRAVPETLFRHVAPLLQDGDINVCQLEATFSNLGTLGGQVRNPAHRVPPENIRALTAAPFHGVTYAGNNQLDYGVEAFNDTMDLLLKEDIFIVGAGRSLTEATSAIVREVNGIKIAFVNTCSILPPGVEATDSRSGISPLPVKTYYDSLEKIEEQPGTPARTVTVVDRDRLNVILNEIKKAKESADFVVASFHWGVHFTHDLAQYQADVGYAAIDAGADIVAGTHPHCLQAVEMYKGKPIFYSLGNFAFEQPGDIAMKGASSYLRLYGIPADMSVPGHPHPAHCRPSVIVKLVLSSEGSISFDLVPTYLNEACEPEPALPGTIGYQKVRDLIVNLSADIGTTVIEEDGVLRVLPNAGGDEDTRDILRLRNISYPSLRYLSTELT